MAEGRSSGVPRDVFFEVAFWLGVQSFAIVFDSPFWIANAARTAVDSSVWLAVGKTAGIGVDLVWLAVGAKCVRAGRCRSGLEGRPKFLACL